MIAVNDMHKRRQRDAMTKEHFAEGEEGFVLPNRTNANVISAQNDSTTLYQMSQVYREVYGMDMPIQEMNDYRANYDLTTFDPVAFKSRLIKKVRSEYRVTVKAAYAKVLNRLPTQHELDTYVQLMISDTLRTQSDVEQLLRTDAGSTAGTLNSRTAETVGDASIYNRVNAIFQETLERQPSQDELAFYYNRMITEPSFDEDKLRAILVSSKEYDILTKSQTNTLGNMAGEMTSRQIEMAATNLYANIYKQIPDPPTLRFIMYKYKEFKLDDELMIRFIQDLWNVEHGVTTAAPAIVESPMYLNRAFAAPDTSVYVMDKMTDHIPYPETPVYTHPRPGLEQPVVVVPPVAPPLVQTIADPIMEIVAPQAPIVLNVDHPRTAYNSTDVLNADGSVTNTGAVVEGFEEEPRDGGGVNHVDPVIVSRPNDPVYCKPAPSIFQPPEPRTVGEAPLQKLLCSKDPYALDNAARYYDTSQYRHARPATTIVQDTITQIRNQEFPIVARAAFPSAAGVSACGGQACYPNTPMHPMRDLVQDGDGDFPYSATMDTINVNSVHGANLNGVGYLNEIYTNKHLGGGVPDMNDIYFEDANDDAIERNRLQYSRV
jgi:hypothetical protein